VLDWLFFPVLTLEAEGVVAVVISFHRLVDRDRVWLRQKFAVGLDASSKQKVAS
jgi:hypothetical protein